MSHSKMKKEQPKVQELRPIEEGYLFKKKRPSQLRLKEYKVLSDFVGEKDALERIQGRSRAPFGQRKVVRYSFNR